MTATRANQCPDCGFKVHAEDLICFRCGANLPHTFASDLWETEADAAAERLYSPERDGPVFTLSCPACGGGVERQDNFCYHCGARLTRDPLPVPSEAEIFRAREPYDDVLPAPEQEDENSTVRPVSERGRHDSPLHRPLRPRRPASKVASAAVWFLPAEHQVRYSEEYLSELWDLAESGAGACRQLRYSFCQLVYTVPMALTLRSPRRRGALP